MHVPLRAVAHTPQAASEPVPSNALQELLPGPNGAPPVFSQFGNWFVRDLPIK